MTSNLQTITLAAAWTSLTVLMASFGSARAGPSPEVSTHRSRPAIRSEADGARRALQPLPQGRAIGRTSPRRCLSLLRNHGVDFELVDHDSVSGVEAPVRLTGRVGGVSVGSRGPSENNEIYDCRLLLVLLAWSADLRAADVVRIDHYSTYRPSATVADTGEPSGHARAMAIDVGRLHRADGGVIDIVGVWTNPVRGANPCEAVDGEGEELTTLRSLVCAAIDRELFQVVLTPHFDRVHRNHVHLELRPEVEWTYVR